ncbi:hypothetical protein AAE478_008346 [Parahypoxylon ruwenzoriense]
MRHFVLILTLWLEYATAESQQNPDLSWLKDHDWDAPKECQSDPAGPLNPSQGQLKCPLLVDDETAFERRSWGPWTYPPVCVEPEKATDAKLCVFTYVNLRGEAGISIVTTPEIAAAGVDILEDHDARWDDWDRGSRLVVSDSPPYEARDLPDKGMGFVANRTIRKGEVVLVRHPVLLRIMDPRPWKLRDVMKLLHRAAVQLPARDALQMMKLARSKGGYVVDDIINTNAFGVLLGDVDHSGLYLDVSRLNHACKPNMFSRFSSTTLAMEVVAYMDIEAGEELTFSYTPLNILSEQRQSLIREWGFNCTCSLCASPDDTAASDRRRGRIQALLEDLDRPEARNRAAVEERVEEILDLCDKEGLAAQVGDFYAIVADIYSSMGDLDLARKHGGLALEELRHYAGYDHERTRNAAAFLENLSRRVGR